MKSSTSVWFGILGWVTAIGTLGLVAVWAAMLLGFSMDDEAPLWVFLACFSLLALGTLAMIVHLNVTKELTEEDKRSWRSLLSFGGPIAASLYFFRRGRAPRSATLSRMGKETWNRPLGRR